jgi:hypothetical protein
MPDRREGFAPVVGRVSYDRASRAHGWVFALVGIFLIKAAIDDNPRAAIGLGARLDLRSLVQQASLILLAGRFAPEMTPDAPSA